MFLKHLKLTNFRNYDSLSIDLSSGVNIVCGDNAQGKTNLLESIYVLGLTKSHRSFVDNTLIKNGALSAKIEGILVEKEFDTSLEMILSSQKKKFLIDKDEIKRTSDYISKMNIIIFYPDDLELIKGSPNIRRRYLNLELSQLYNQYYNVLNDYNKLIKIRNDYLKKMSKDIPVDENYFNIVTTYLVEKGSQIYVMRQKFINKLNERVNHIYKEITGFDDFYLLYQHGLFVKDSKLESYKMAMQEKLNKMYSVEKRLGTTMVGPHRDDFEFYLGDKNVRNFGSQGQQRVAVLTVKLAEIDIFKSYRNTTPILLLDDVFSELDVLKKNNLLRYINSQIQTIITTTDLESINREILKEAKIYTIASGKIVQNDEVIENG